MRETLAMRMCSAAVCIDPVYLMDNGVNVSQLHNWFFTEITHTHKIGTQRQRETIRSTEKKRTRRGDNVDYCFHPFFFHFCFFFFYRALVNAVCVQKCLLWKLAVKCLIGLNPFDKTSKNLSAMYFFFLLLLLSLCPLHSFVAIRCNFVYVCLTYRWPNLSFRHNFISHPLGHFVTAVCWLRANTNTHAPFEANTAERWWWEEQICHPKTYCPFESIFGCRSECRNFNLFLIVPFKIVYICTECCFLLLLFLLSAGPPNNFR